MRIQKRLSRLLLASALSASAMLYGCGAESNLETLRGEPISVQAMSGYGSNSVSTVIRVEDEEILCHAIGGLGTMSKLGDAAALIDSEIRDGDNESIELIGRYEGKIFYISSVSANGYTLKF